MNLGWRTEAEMYPGAETPMVTFCLCVPPLRMLYVSSAARHGETSENAACVLTHAMGETSEDAAMF